jgi:hypothetical protein
LVDRSVRYDGYLMAILEEAEGELKASLAGADDQELGQLDHLTLRVWE